MQGLRSGKVAPAVEEKPFTLTTKFRTSIHGGSSKRRSRRVSDSDDDSGEEEEAIQCATYYFNPSTSKTSTVVTSFRKRDGSKGVRQCKPDTKDPTTTLMDAEYEIMDDHGNPIAIENIEDQTHHLDSVGLQRFLRESKLFLTQEDVDDTKCITYDGKLRTMEPSTGVLVPPFHPERNMYVLLVPTDTKELIFYTTSFNGSILVNYKFPHLPVKLSDALRVQKVVITVNKNESSTDGDGDGKVKQQFSFSHPNTPVPISSSFRQNSSRGSNKEISGGEVTRYLIDVRKTVFTEAEDAPSKAKEHAPPALPILKNTAAWSNAHHVYMDANYNADADEGGRTDQATGRSVSSTDPPLSMSQISLGTFVRVLEAFQAGNHSHLSVKVGDVICILKLHGMWMFCSKGSEAMQGWLPIRCILTREQQLEYSLISNGTVVGNTRTSTSAHANNISNPHDQHHQQQQQHISHQHLIGSKPLVCRRAFCIFHTLHVELCFTRRPWVSVVYCILQAIMLIIGIIMEKGIDSTIVNPLLGPSPIVLYDLGAMHAPKVVLGKIYYLLSSLFTPVGIISFFVHVAIIAVVCIPLERTHGSLVTFSALIIGGIGGNLLGCVSSAQLLLTGASPAVFGGFGAVVSQLIIFKHNRSFIIHDVIILLVLMFICLIFGLFPFQSNWQAFGGLMFGFATTLHQLVFASTAKPPQNNEIVEEDTDGLYPQGPYLPFRCKNFPLLIIFFFPTHNHKPRIHTRTHSAYTLDTLSKRMDVGYSGMFMAWLGFLVLCVLTFIFLDKHSTSCSWCVKASCFPAYDWCHTNSSSYLQS
eukprot:m.101074 g.101074  ORF g.101074 m.101074 type:complete len:813 (-) comp9057_c0_seq2:4159-6597(-)